MKKHRFRSMIATAALVLGFSGVESAIAADCQQFEGTWVMITHHDGYYEHELSIAVDYECRIRGTWRHLNASGGESSIEGGIVNDYVEFTRFAEDFRQSYIGRWAPTFAGGSFENIGVWFMEKR